MYVAIGVILGLLLRLGLQWIFGKGWGLFLTFLWLCIFLFFGLSTLAPTFPASLFKDISCTVATFAILGIIVVPFLLAKVAIQESTGSKAKGWLGGFLFCMMTTSIIVVWGIVSSFHNGAEVDQDHQITQPLEEEPPPPPPPAGLRTGSNHQQIKKGANPSSQVTQSEAWRKERLEVLAVIKTINVEYKRICKLLDSEPMIIDINLEYDKQSRTARLTPWGGAAGIGSIILSDILKKIQAVDFESLEETKKNRINQSMAVITRAKTVIEEKVKQGK
jgi:hypothetical protein